MERRVVALLLAREDRPARSLLPTHPETVLVDTRSGLEQRDLLLGPVEPTRIDHRRRLTLRRQNRIVPLVGVVPDVLIILDLPSRCDPRSPRRQRKVRRLRVHAVVEHLLRRLRLTDRALKDALAFHH